MHVTNSQASLSHYTQMRLGTEASLYTAVSSASVSSNMGHQHGAAACGIESHQHCIILTWHNITCPGYDVLVCTCCVRRLQQPWSAGQPGPGAGQLCAAPAAALPLLGHAGVSGWRHCCYVSHLHSACEQANDRVVVICDKCCKSRDSWRTECCPWHSCCVSHLYSARTFKKNKCAGIKSESGVIGPFCTVLLTSSGYK